MRDARVRRLEDAGRHPDQAKWLSAEEKELLRRDLAVDRDEGTRSFREVLRDPRVYALAIGYFCLISGLYAVSFWLPMILKENGLTDTVRIGLYSALPYAFAIVLMVVLGRRSTAPVNAACTARSRR